MPKNYPLIQVKAPTWFLQKIIMIFQVILFIVAIIAWKLSFNPGKGPYLIPSASHSDIPSKLYSSLPKFTSADHSDILSHLYSSFNKVYPSTQVKASTWFLQHIIQIFQVSFIHNCLNFLWKLIQICEVVFIHHFLNWWIVA